MTPEHESSPRGRYARCRHLRWEISSQTDEPAPGRYCRTELGVIHVLDCPVYQGLSCTHFDPRPEEEPDPAPAPDEEGEELREELARDYLRWPYWRRVRLLRGEEEPTAPVAVGEEKEEEPEEEEEESEVRSKPLAPEEDEPGLNEKYPGQRRSEDKLRSRKAARPSAVEEGPAPERPTRKEPTGKNKKGRPRRRRKGGRRKGSGKQQGGGRKKGGSKKAGSKKKKS